MKIFVGMSGGVDSSVAAAILQKQGHDVSGITLRLLDKDANAAADAKQVCGFLGIEHFVLDLRQTFQERVMDYFSEEYFRARTPNPCIECNRHIKFGAMLDFALEHGGEKIATGHYANLEQANGRYAIKKAGFLPKDQSYVLYTLSQHQLAHSVFPLGNCSKDETRQLAAQIGLPVAMKKDSQDICFIPDGDYVAFIKDRHNPPVQPGFFVDHTGAKVGQHTGVWQYTCGQRKGLGAFGCTMYVKKINPDTGDIHICPKGGEFSKSCAVEQLNWVSVEKIEKTVQAQIKIRYGAQPADGVLHLQENGDVLVEFAQPQRAVTPGQAAVFYNGDVLLGGGRIAIDNGQLTMDN